MHAMQFQLSYVDSFVRHSAHVAGSMRHRNQSDDDEQAPLLLLLLGNICQAEAAMAVGRLRR